MDSFLPFWLNRSCTQPSVELDRISRAAFFKRYFKLNWPEIHLYDAMFNTETGDSFVAEMLGRCIQEVAGRTSAIPEFTVPV
jgi:hypothetical protein